MSKDNPEPNEMTQAQIDVEVDKQILGSRIKRMESMGATGKTNPTLHALNVKQTNSMSNSEIASTIRSRRAAGKPTDKLEAAARDKGIYY